MQKGNLYISVVIPTYNEEERIEGSIKTVEQYLRDSGFDYEIIISDDGSTDKTLDAPRKIMAGNEKIKLVINEHKGKGGAVRAGILQSTGDFVLFTDADLSTPIEELERLKKALDEGYDIAIASRDLPGSKILKHQSWYRELLGKFLNRIIQLLYVPGISDTQCGFKLFKGKVARELFSRQKINGLLFDVEVLYSARKKNYRIAEVPVTWRHNEFSKVSIVSDLPRVIWDLINIRFLY